MIPLKFFNSVNCYRQHKGSTQLLNGLLTDKKLKRWGSSRWLHITSVSLRVKKRNPTIKLDDYNPSKISFRNDKLQNLKDTRVLRNQTNVQITTSALKEVTENIKEKIKLDEQESSKPENLVPRPPVVTIMGHVDHGKTTLLDALRNTFVAQNEFGGITQHIGAFSVDIKGRKITFIDTPGHAAFSSMRSRGAQVTDLVVLVIAADDGIMEQTIESIRIAQKAAVQLIVAVNKIDKAKAQSVEEISNNLLNEGIQVECEGGNIQLVPISALKKINLDLLTEVILLEADLLNLKGDPTGLVEGVVIESKVDKKGPMATIIITRGTLTKRKILIAGNGYGRVRLMLDDKGVEYVEAGPSTPVQIFGWKILPFAGDKVLEVKSEKIAARYIKSLNQEKLERKQETDEKIIREKADALKEITTYERMYYKSLNKQGRKEFRREKYHCKSNPEEKNQPELNIIVKTDVYGSLEVLTDILNTYDHHNECKMCVLKASVGQIIVSDIELAESSNAIIYAFNVQPHPTVMEELKRKNIDVRFYNVIYKLMDDLKEELNSRIPSVDVEEIIGEADIQEKFVITDKKKKCCVAGCKCTTGHLEKQAMYKIISGKNVIFQGFLTSMKHHKEEVSKILKNTECGLLFKDCTEEFKPGDKIICYKMSSQRQETSWDPGF